MNSLLAIYPDLYLLMIVFCGNKHTGDNQVTNALLDGIKNTNNVQIFDYNKNSNTFYEVMSTCTLVIAMRLHAAILAYTAGIPFFMLSYNQKCISFAYEIGLRNNHLFESNSLEGSSFKESIKKWFESEHQDKKPWVLPLSDARISSLKNFIFLDQNISKNISVVTYES